MAHWFQIGKGVHQHCILSPCLFNLYAEFSSVQLLSHARLFVTPWTAALRPPCPSPTPGVYPNSCPWYHPTISSSVVPFSSCPQSVPASGSFPMRQLFTSGGQSTSFSFSISPSNEYSGLISLRMDWLDLLAIQGTLKSLLQHQLGFKSINSLVLSFL